MQEAGTGGGRIQDEFFFLNNVVVSCGIRVSNTPGNPGILLEICKMSWEFFGLVRRVQLLVFNT